MTRVASVDDLEAELAAQAAAGQAALAAQQEAYAALEAAAAERERTLEATIGALESVREELRRARAELQWLRRAGIDLNAVMDHRAVRGVRAAGRVARRARAGGGPPASRS